MADSEHKRDRIDVASFDMVLDMLRDVRGQLENIEAELENLARPYLADERWS